MKTLKLLFIVLTNIKVTICRHTVVFLLLILGLLISSFALSSYYAYSTGMLETTNIIYGLNTSIELYPKELGLDKPLETLKAFLVEKNLPLKNIVAVSYDLRDMDIVGIWGDYAIPSIQKGNMDTTNEKRAIVVSSELLNNKDIQQIGTKYRTGKNSYQISGVLELRGYMPDEHDIRRVSDEKFTVTDTMNEDAAAQSQGSDYVGYITYDTFLEDGYHPDVVKINFTSPMSKEQKKQLETEILMAIVPEDFMAWPDDMPQSEKLLQSQAMLEDLHVFAQYKTAAQVYTADYISKLIIYLAMILIGFVNVIAVYNYILMANRNQIGIYRMTGGTNVCLFVAMFVELFIYCLVTFTMGWLASRIFMTNASRFVLRTKGMGFSDFIVLLGVMTVLVIATTIRQMIKAIKNSASSEVGWNN